MNIGKYVGLAGMILAIGCGGAGGAHREPGLEAGHLPELLRFARFGETTPEEAAAQFTADNLYVTSSVGRELTVHARGPNQGRPYAYVNVTRRQDGSGYVGELGDEYTLRFEFTNFEPGGDLRLFGLEITQPLSEPNVCAPAAELAEGEGLLGCHDDSVYHASRPDASGYYHACTSTPEGYPLAVRCSSTAGDNRLFSASVGLGRADSAP